MAKGKQTNDDLPADDADSPLSDRDEAANTDQEDLSTDEEEPPEMHKIGKAMMAASGTAMSSIVRLSSTRTSATTGSRWTCRAST